MNVKNKEQAWIYAKTIIPDLAKDYESSSNAGYNIYRSVENGENYVSDLGPRLEINLGSETINVWIKQPTTLKEYAECESATITIRSYHDGNSKDTIRDTTPEEQKILFGILYGTLEAIGSGVNMDVAISIAECIGLNIVENINTFDSIYYTIKKCPFIKNK